MADDAESGLGTVQALIRTGAVQVGSSLDAYTFTSGTKSPIYVDNRRLLGDVDARRTCASDLEAAVDRLGGPPDVIVGTATAGIPWATLLAERFGLPLSYVRSSTKAWGLQKQVEGAPVDGKSTIIVEDLLFTAGSAVASAEALRAGGAKVEGVVALVSYETASQRDALILADLRASYVTTVASVIDAHFGSGAEGPTLRRQVGSWLQRFQEDS